MGDEQAAASEVCAAVASVMHIPEVLKPMDLMSLAPLGEHTFEEPGLWQAVTVATEASFFECIVGAITGWTIGMAWAKAHAKHASTGLSAPRRSSARCWRIAGPFLGSVFLEKAAAYGHIYIFDGGRVRLSPEN